MLETIKNFFSSDYEITEEEQIKIMEDLKRERLNDMSEHDLHYELKILNK